MSSVLKTALINPLAAGKFIEQDTVTQFNVPIRPLQQLCKIQAIDRAPIGGGTIAHCTELLSLQIGTLHKESITMYITVSARHPIIFALT